MSKKLDSPKKKCEHKDTSPSSDPLIWYVCHDCGAHLNQRFEVIPASYHAIVNEVLKTEKIDSETLKRIKNLAQEESDFYDKHGYYSFWSDKLKAQRIKDSEGYKDAKFDLYSSDKDYEIGKVLKQTEKKELTLDELLAKCDKCPTVFTQRSDGMFGCDLRCKDVDNKEEKKEDYFDRQIRLGNIPKYQEDSGGEKELPNRETAFYEASHGINGKPNVPSSKLPDLICPFCGRKLIRYKQAWICGHGCTKPALKPKEKLPEPKTEPEKDPYGIEGKYGVWTKQELINECNVLVSNMDALHELHLKEKGELIEEFLRKMVEIYFSLGDTKVENLMFAELKQEYEGRLKK